MKNKYHILPMLLVLLCLQFAAIGQPPRGPFVISPMVHKDKTVTFGYLAPNAKEVKLSGQFLKEPVAMTKDSVGIWKVTVGPVKPDIYPYNFNVDGISVMDPSNVDYFPNERFKGSLLDVPGDTPLMHAMKDVPHGAMTYNYYPSMEGSTGTIVVYTPPGYDYNQAVKYPVFYLISGTTDTEETFFKVGKVNMILDNMIAEGKAKPMIVVMPYGNPIARIAEQTGQSKPTDVANRDSDDAVKRLKFFEDDLVGKIIPYVEKNYRVAAGKENRAIAGFSRGGGQTLRAAFNHVDKFAWVCSYASYVSPSEIEQSFPHIIKDAAKTNKDFKLFWSGIGTEDFLYKGTTEFNDFLKSKGIALKTYETDGGHTWMNVKKYLNETLPLLFR
ncbi:MAG: esterase [Saprospiraceae bacterium]|nr:esterase [Saprospiraceae bacterium]